jgi:hypothetical protein
MLEVGRVINARSEERDSRLALAMRSDIAEHVEQFLAVILDRAHPILAEKARESAFHRLAVLDDVRNAGRATRVVFQDQIFPFLVADEVGAADVNVDIARHIEVHELRPEMRRLPDDLFRDHAILEDVLPVVDVVEE